VLDESVPPRLADVPARLADDPDVERWLDDVVEELERAARRAPLTTAAAVTSAAGGSIGDHGPGGDVSAGDLAHREAAELRAWARREAAELVDETRRQVLEIYEQLRIGVVAPGD
jgi:hypothetical protein